MSKKGGLGKGLGAIFGENTSPAVEKVQEPASAAQELLIKNIAANPYQPRCNFDEEKLQELAASIKEFGVVQPVVVRKKGRSYELVAGERRLRAAGLAGLTKVPAIVKDYDDAKMMEIALIENLQSEDLHFLEEAEGYEQLMEQFHLTQEAMAARVGKKQSTIDNKLRLLRLSPAVRKVLVDAGLSERHARALLKLDDDAKRLEVLEVVVAKNYSVRQTEEYINKLLEDNQQEKRRRMVIVIIVSI